MKKILFTAAALMFAFFTSAQQNKMKIDFAYAFGEPHRLTVALPNSSHKAIFDASKEQFQMAWTDHDCTDNPIGAYIEHPLTWRIIFTAKADTTQLKGVHWHRIADWIPAFCYEWEGNDVVVKVHAVATEKGDVLMFDAVNNGKTARKVRIDARVRNNNLNMKWVDFKYKYSIVTPIFEENGDRMIILDPEPTDVVPDGREHLNAEFSLAAGAKSSRIFVCPNKAYLDDLQRVVTTDWKAEAQKGLQVWKDLLAKAPQLIIPDQKIVNAAKASLADLFVMREKQADGMMAGLCGTDLYRATNSIEPNLQGYVLSLMGYFKEGRENIEFTSRFQEADGNWNDFRQWDRFMWGASGFKSYYTKEYYLLSRDTSFLKEQFSRMLASSRWSQKQREITKKDNNSNSPEWGLMPRGMGDGGLKNGTDLLGVFYPHNFFHCMGLEANAWAAKELGRKDVYDELYADYKDLYDCLHKSLKTGAIREADGTVWIPGTPNKTSGSRWGVADAVYPAKILAANDPLAVGTMKNLQSNLSEGGLPLNLGWMDGGLWMAISLDAMAYVNILQGNADQSAAYLYAAINHGTPFYTWCEERKPEPGATTITGDRQHAWTPICVTQFTRNSLVMEDEEAGCLWLTRAVPRQWYEIGNKIGIKDAPTEFGKISYTVERTKTNRLSFTLTLKDYDRSHPLKLQLRLPDKIKGRISTSAVKGAKVTVEKDCLTINPKSNEITGEIRL